MPHNTDNDKFHKHQQYLNNQSDWEMITDLLDGNHSCLTREKYLWLHPMEDPARQCDQRDKNNAVADRKLREQRTQYINYMKMVRDRFVSLIMKGGLNMPDEVLELFGNEINNVDGQETSFEEFMKRVAEDIVSFGPAYVMTDSRTIQARNIREEQESEARPYWIKLAPLNVEDWQIGATGEYEAFRYEYFLLEERQSLEQEPELVHYTTIAQLIKDEEDNAVYELQTWASIDDKGHFVNHHDQCSEPRTHASWRLLRSVVIDELDSLPLATNRIQEGELRRVVPISLKVYNKESDLDNLLFDQGYERAFIMADLQGALGADGEPLSDEAKQVKISTNSLVILPETASVMKLDPSNPVALIQSINNDAASLFSIAFNILRAMPTDSKVAESSDTRKEVKEALLTRIECNRRQLLDVMKMAIKDYAMFKDTSNTDFEFDLEFAQSVTEADLDEISNFVKTHADRIARYELAEKEIDKKILGHPILNLPKKEELIEEIENTTLPTADPAESAVNQSREQLQGLVTNNARPQRKVPQRDNRNRETN